LVDVAQKIFGLLKQLLALTGHEERRATPMGNVQSGHAGHGISLA
jgi:transketolase N-terminal domain/subunit